MLCRSHLIASAVAFVLIAGNMSAQAPAKAPNPAPAPLPLPPVEGVVKEITRDEYSATGLITIVDNTGKATSYVLGEATIFELVRGTVVVPSNFLREHIGENARIYPIAVGDSLGALTVQILLPPAVKRLYPNTGKVIAVAANSITIQSLPHRKPPEPVIGVVTDVTFDPKNETGSMTVKVDGKDVKYTANPWTRFVKVKDGIQQPTNFLKEYRGETVVVYPSSAESTMVRQVDIIQRGTSAVQDIAKEHVRKFKETKAHQYTYQVNANTEYEFVRDGKHTPAQLSNVLVGEIVSILPTGFHSFIAKHVDIHLPHALHGEVTDFTAASLTVKVHRHATLDRPAYEAILTVPLLQTTIYETVEDMMTQTVTFAALKKSQHVVIYRTGVPPHPAEKVLINHHTKAVVTRGTLTGMANGAIVVTVTQLAKGGNPATTTQNNFQVPQTASIILASNQQPTTMTLGDDVTVYANIRQGVTGPADKIEVRPAVPKAITAHGAFVSLANGTVSINVKHGGGKDGKPATTTQESFQLGPMTTIILTSNQQATTLLPGDQLTIHAHSRGGIVGPAEKIEVNRKKVKGK